MLPKQLKLNSFIENYFFHPDHLGSSTAITDGAGYAYQIFLNLPFGETMAEQRRSGTFNNAFKFNGKELDTETGLYYYGARYYNPRTSVWLSVDPLAEKYPGWSPYNYTFNNPIVFTDPDGRWPWPTKNDPWVKGAGFFRNIFKNGSKIHAQNFADRVGGNVVEGAGWDYHVFYSSDDGYWRHKANFKKGSKSAKPESIHSFSASLPIEGHSLIMGNILDIPVDLAMYGIVQGAEILGMSEEDAAKMAGVLIVINDLKGLKVNKIIRNADDLIQAAGKFSNEPRGKVGENTIQGNVDDIFITITTGGFKRESGAIEMPNGTIINKHSSQNGNTIDIRLPDESKNHKIRIED